ncbi:MAG TPA: FAD-dependent oxidoreductase [Pyrinomonadaceae bacterium]|jgi:glycine/D-amino acid oxidase-like deaminating enzyme/nitrite reductase/ring-hydroxylating ferredoxin subunit|nr:FAD-dependent oxidoreductase [Pyrinomonadaceae bacterium]
MGVIEIGDVDKGDELPGRPVSLWLATTPGTNYPALEGDVSVDVAVLGGGIAGLATAYMLKQAGATVAVLEAGRVVESVTGNTTAKITSQHGLVYDQLISDFGEERARLYGEAQEAAKEKIASLVAQLGVDCDFRRTSAYTYTLDEREREQVEREADAAKRLGLPASYTEDTDLPFGVKAAVRFDNQAQFHPRKYLLALAETIPGGGSHIFEGTRALDIEEAETCTVKAANGTVRAKSVVVSTHFPFKDPNIYFAAMYPTRSYVLGCRLNGPVPQGMYLSTGSPHRSIRNNPYEDGEIVMLGGEHHKTGQDGDTRERYQRLEEWARANFDVRSIEFRWSTQDNNTVDGVPYIGKLSSGSERLYVATGFKGWGMTNSHVAALLLTDMIQGRENPWAEVFDPSRFKPVTSARDFLRENMNVAKEFMADRVSTPELKSLDDIPPGHGEVVRWQGERVAVYKDERGAVSACSAVCTHMGCIVHWNSAEKSWDCPCHGSRFDHDGRVIQGPANEDLEAKPLGPTAGEDEQRGNGAK